MPRNNLTPRKKRRVRVGDAGPSRAGQYAYDPVLGQIVTSKDGVWSVMDSQFWSPVALFAAGEQGVWYDPSDLSTMFQDHLGTIPAAYGSPVGLVRDKSGRGNHASQPTVTARPTLGRVPIGGRRNLLLNTEVLAAWQGSATRTVVATVQGIMLTEVTDTATDSNHNVNQVVSGLKPNTTYMLSGYLKRGTSNISMLSMQGAGVPGSNQLRATWNPDGTLLALDGSGTQGYFEAVGGGLYRFWKPVTANATGGSAAIYVWPTAYTVSGDQIGSVIVGGIQLEEGSVVTPYQRVGASAFDVTEQGIPSLSYLNFDGVDDFMSTPALAPGSDKVQIFVGARKQSDAATALFAEFGPNVGTSNGAFFLAAPLSAAAPNYSFNSKGTIAGNAISPSNYPAPTTNVLTGIGDISGDSSKLRIDGAQVAERTGDQGAGNFLTYPLYIGCRGGLVLHNNMLLYGLAVRFAGNLELPQIQGMESWIAGKTGVSL